MPGRIHWLAADWFAFGWGALFPQRVTLWTAEQERSTAVDIHA
jgi:hypothetical protein